MGIKKFITVAGNIGAGKSTLVKLLSERLGWQPFYEPVADNPYLADFYQDMNAWSFHSQVFFLTHRLCVYQELSAWPSSVILDRSLYEDAEIFAGNLFRQGLMNERDFKTYMSLYMMLLNFLPTPDLVVYLRTSVPTLIQRIHNRGRDFERGMDQAYLQTLNDAYEKWISDFTLCPVLTVPSDDLNLVANPQHMDLIVQKVREKIAGQEEVIFRPEEYNQD
jgi:deoxyadenosine/deoxycytidine kinase